MNTSEICCIERIIKEIRKYSDVYQAYAEGYLPEEGETLIIPEILDAWAEELENLT